MRRGLLEGRLKSSHWSFYESMATLALCNLGFFQPVVIIVELIISAILDMLDHCMLYGRSDESIDLILMSIRYASANCYNYLNK